MKTLLIIAVLINGAPITKYVYIVKDAKCEYVRDHWAVQESWKEIFGENTIIYCTEGSYDHQ